MRYVQDYIEVYVRMTHGQEWKKRWSTPELMLSSIATTDEPQITDSPESVNRAITLGLACKWAHLVTEIPKNPCTALEAHVQKYLNVNDIVIPVIAKEFQKSKFPAYLSPSSANQQRSLANADHDPNFVGWIHLNECGTYAIICDYVRYSNNHVNTFAERKRLGMTRTKVLGVVFTTETQHGV